MANRIPGVDFNCKSLFCCYSGRKLGPYSNTKQSIIVHCFGEVSEWLIEQPWKGCVGLVPTAGSNPAISVTLERVVTSSSTSVENVLQITYFYAKQTQFPKG